MDNFYCTWSVGAGSFAHYKKGPTREFLDTLQKYPITKFTSIYSTYTNALYEKDLKSFRFPKLKRCYTAGEPITKQVLRKWKEVTGVELWDYYGQTEIVSCCTTWDASPSSTSSSGLCLKLATYGATQMEWLFSTQLNCKPLIWFEKGELNLENYTVGLQPSPWLQPCARLFVNVHRLPGILRI